MFKSLLSTKKWLTRQRFMSLLKSNWSEVKLKLIKIEFTISDLEPKKLLASTVLPGEDSKVILFLVIEWFGG